MQELSRYRSEFFGRLRAILGNRPDIRIVGDRFVFQSVFLTGQALLLPEGRTELDKLATALIDLDKQIPERDRLGAAGRRPHRHAADQLAAVQVELELSSARAISVVQYLVFLGVLAAAGRRRFCRIPAARHRAHRRGLQAQPPHRTEADGTVSGRGFTLRPYRAEDEDAAIELWRLTWQQAYPAIDFTARVAWWRERWRHELVANAQITVAEQAQTLIDLVTIDEAATSTSSWSAPITGARRWRQVWSTKPSACRPAALRFWSTRTTRAIRFYERNGFAHAGEDVNPTSAGRC